jgi:hypothetical protein
VARATDGHNTLAMLKRRESETLAQLLTRLDMAIGKAFTEDIFTDEINTPLKNSHRRWYAGVDDKKRTLTLCPTARTNHGQYCRRAASIASSDGNTIERW